MSLPLHLFFAAAVVAPAASPAPNVLLITVDTLRPDALGWTGGRNATPVIDRLAADGFRFRSAVSPAPVTLPAHASIMTGLTPRRHGARDNGQPLADGVPTLAESLRGRGYATAGFVSGFPLVRAFGLDRGFAHFDDDLPDGPADRRERRAARTTAVAAAWIAAARQPWFAWVHYYDPHDPYEAPGPVRGDRRAAYDAEVAYVDQAIASLRDRVAARPGLRTLTVFAADHGESLGEHGESTHGFFLYDSTVTVPLVFHFPGRVAPGESGQPARLVDIAPTILDLAGVPPLAAAEGISLVPLLSGRTQIVPPAVIETLRPWASYGWSPLRALRDAAWKYIASPRPELYDLLADPRESADRVAAEGGRAQEMAAALTRSDGASAAASPRVPDAETAARLSALGYVGAGARAPAGDPPPGLADPKDRVRTWNDLGEAEQLMAARRYADALARFDVVLASEPVNRFALSRSGQALLELGRGPEAIARLERAVGVGAEHPESRLALAQALFRLGRPQQAALQWTELTRLQPREPAHWVGLGNALGLSRQPGPAATAFARASALRPDDPELLTRLAFAEHASGRDADAALHLTQAAERQGPAAFPHAGALGVLLAQLGRPGPARRWLAVSRPAEADFAEARYQLARLQAQAGEVAAARRALAEALKASPVLRLRAVADERLAPLLR